MVKKAILFMSIAIAAYAGECANTNRTTPLFWINPDSSVCISYELYQIVASDSGKGGHYTACHDGGKVTEIFLDKDRELILIKGNFRPIPRSVSVPVPVGVSSGANFGAISANANYEVVFDPVSKTYAPVRK
jgi:hypothetical protein